MTYGKITIGYILVLMYNESRTKGREINMTEIEKIAYAKSFIDKLANGINPIDGTEIKPDDVVNNVRLTRCFFYVSDILRQVIENGGTSRVRHKKKSFSVSEEQLEKFNYSDTPIAISEIARRISSLPEDENMKRISYRDITKWLVSIGMLNRIISEDGKTITSPTDQGLGIGISIEERFGKNGPYTVVLYNREAQSFILDNFEAVLALKKK